ncbi:MAG: 50S ribosomal protein L15 [Armatimonadetes bacterium]|nr:50S ribosomal protein L15 [Armatimonadota bacterium]
MRLDELQPNEGARKTPKRVGRGRASGDGKTCGRGTKGQHARGSVRPGFEGGQTPLHMRTPKLRGNTKKRSRNIGLFRPDYAIVNVGALAVFEAGAEVDHEMLVLLGICRAGKSGLRVLGDGSLEVALTVRAGHFSAAAKAKIEAAGGSAVLVGADSSE